MRRVHAKQETLKASDTLVVATHSDESNVRQRSQPSAHSTLGASLACASTGSGCRDAPQACPTHCNGSGGGVGMGCGDGRCCRRACRLTASDSPGTPDGVPCSEAMAL